MSTVTYLGDQLVTLLEDMPAEFVMDETGVASASMSYSCKWDSASRLAAAVRYHPDFTWLKKKKVTVTRDNAYMARLRIEFEGVNPDGEGSGEYGETTVYSLETSVSSEPIETHPDFKDLAGQWDDKSTWINGAHFETSGDDAGKFKGFKTTIGTSMNPKGGITSFLDPGVTYSETKIYPRGVADRVGVNMNNVGNIDTPPNSAILPTVASGRNWLLTECSAETIGDGIRITRKWRLSGRKGWDVDIYS